MNASPKKESDKRKNMADKNRHRGIYLLPNLFTTAALFSGFYAIVVAMEGRFESAAVAIFVAMIMDGLDGRVARMTNTQSDFGAEYDSLSDMVSFGVAPALVMYQWGFANLSSLGGHWFKVGWLVTFVYVACAALRLARFNTLAGSDNPRYFRGLPSPAAAAVLAGLIWACTDWGLSSDLIVVPALLVTLGAGLLMVSNFVYYSFKDLRLTERVPFFYILILVALFILIAIHPATILFGAFMVYMMTGLAWWLKKLVQVKMKGSTKPVE